MAQNMELYISGLKDNGFNSALGGTMSGAFTFSGAITFSGPLTFTGTRTSTKPAVTDLTPVAQNTSATLTTAQVIAGYITVTSTSAVTLTMPSGTALGGAVGATQGMFFDLIIDNTASTSSGIVTMAVGTNAVQSDWDNQITTATASVTPAAITPLTIAVGVSGIAVYRITFSSATAYVFSRTA